MGYLHIENLYRAQTMLLFRECYALEKIHGTSAHISWNEGKVGFFSGGEKYESFKAIFDEAKLTEAFTAFGMDKVIVYGEAYGGKCQGMSHTYGKQLKFVAFDVQIGEKWLDVPNMAQVVTDRLGLEAVHFDRIPATVELMNAARDADSVQAVRNGVGPGKKMEGVVLRPLVELCDNYGNRVIVKHKRDDFKETSTARKVEDPAKLQVLTEAKAIADEWVTDMRLRHVLDKLPEDKRGIDNMPGIIQAMVEDVRREAKGEIVESKDAYRAIGGRTAQLFKAHLKGRVAVDPMWNT